jgi:hypothetical protein
LQTNKNQAAGGETQLPKLNYADIMSQIKAQHRKRESMVDQLKAAGLDVDGIDLSGVEGPNGFNSEAFARALNQINAKSKKDPKQGGGTP